MGVNLQSIGKNVFSSKKLTNKNDTNESWTVRLSLASYDELISRLWILHAHKPSVMVLAQAYSNSFCLCQAVSHAYRLEFKLRKYNSRSHGVLGSPRAQTCVLKAFSGLAFFNGRIFLHDIDEMTC